MQTEYPKLTFRITPDLEQQFEAAKATTKRSGGSILRECVEVGLPIVLSSVAKKPRNKKQSHSY